MRRGLIIVQPSTLACVTSIQLEMCSTLRVEAGIEEFRPNEDELTVLVATVYLSLLSPPRESTVART